MRRADVARHADSPLQLRLPTLLVLTIVAGDVLIRFEAESYEGLKASPNVGVAVQPTGAYLQFQFRFKPPFDNLLVRQAVEYAVDKNQINTVVQDGLGYKDVLNTNEAAKLLGISARALRALAEAGDVPSRRIGRMYKFERRAVLDWLGRRT